MRKIGNSIGKGVKKIASGIDNQIIDPALDSASLLTRKSKKGYLGRNGKIEHTKNKEELWNLYTGLRPTGFANALGWGAAGLYGTYKTIDELSKSKVGSVSYEGQIPSMKTSSSAPTLGASGDLVFGLNSMRRG